MAKKRAVIGHLVLVLFVFVAFLISSLYYKHRYFVNIVNSIQSIIYIIASMMCYEKYRDTKARYFLNLIMFLIFSLMGDLLYVFYGKRVYDLFYVVAYINVFLALDKLYKSLYLFKFNKSIVLDTLVVCYVTIYTLLLYSSNNIVKELTFDIVYVIFDILLLFYIVMNLLKMTSSVKIRRHVMYILSALMFYFVADLIYFIVDNEIKNLYTSFADILYIYTGLYVIFSIILLKKTDLYDTIVSLIKSSLKTKSLEIYFAWIYSILLLIFVISFTVINSNELNLTFNDIGVYIIIFSIMLFRMFSNIMYITANVKRYDDENTFDVLTKFYKREKLTDIINKINRFKNRAYPITLLMIDIDEMQVYNSIFGIEAGNLRIKLVAEYINKFFGDDGVCIRYGGDEFLIILLNKNEDVVNERLKQFEGYVEEQNKYVQNKINLTYYSLTFEEVLDLEKALYSLEMSLTRRRLSKKKIVNEMIEEKNRQQIEEQQIEVLKSFLKIVQLKDSYTEGHSTRVAEYAALIAKYMKLSDYEIKKIYTAGVLHDIGKVLIPTEILNKNGPLNEEEKNIMSKHPVYGYEIVSSLNILKEVAPLIKYHHERYSIGENGHSGYPNEKHGEDIPIGARILAVADSFDAMITDRPYRKGMPIEKAVNILREEAGKQFDPQIVNIFTSMVEHEMKMYKKNI